MLSETKSTSGGKQNTIILGVILLLVVGAIGFGVGYKIGQTKNQFTSQIRGNGQFANGGTRGQVGNQAGGSMRGNRQIAGEVIALDDKTMTIKMADGSSKIILLSSTMTISKSIDAPKTDLKVGSKVAVFGAQNTDGSQTATTVELDPKFFGAYHTL